MADRNFDARLDLVPTSPGVYLMKDNTGTVIYVGKAINLRRRLQSYFNSNPVGNSKVLAMIDNIASYSYLLVRNELEALLLESNLIKRYQPFYNILLKDDHDYPYIKVSMQDEFPKITKAYRIGADERLGARYYGPYLNYDLTRALNIIRRLFPMRIYHRIFQTTEEDDVAEEIYFKLSDSEISEIDGNDIDSLSSEDSRLISESSKRNQDKNKPAMDPNEYLSIIHDVCDFLEGKYEGVKARMRKEMQTASEDLDFERAAIWRDRLYDLMRLQEKQVAVLNSGFYGDVIALARNSVEVCIQKLEVRGGRITGTSTYFLDAAANSDREIILAFLLQYYTSASYIPPNILLPIEIEPKEEYVNNEISEDSEELGTQNKQEELEVVLPKLLRELAGKKVNLHHPQRGEKREVLDLASRNAKQSLHRKTLVAGSNPESLKTAMELLAEILNMKNLPYRIEAYDISNTGNEDMACGMAVFENAKVKRNDSRIFNIKYQDVQDDYSAMAEAVDRRLSHLGDDKFAAKPDLILADGGIGHVNALKAVLDKHGMLDKIALGGMVKDQRHRTRGLVTFDGEIIELSEALDLLDGKKTYGSGNELGSADNLFSENKSTRREEQLALLRFLSAIQNETHRVANKANKNLNRKRQIKYKLEEIPGVGEARRKALMRAFTSIKEISQSSAEEILERVPALGEKVAKNIYDHFHADNSTE